MVAYRPIDLAGHQSTELVAVDTADGAAKPVDELALAVGDQRPLDSRLDVFEQHQDVVVGEVGLGLGRAAAGPFLEPADDRVRHLLRYIVSGGQTVWHHARPP